MKIEKFEIKNIPTILWGEKSEKIFIAVHGNMSNKEDESIKIFAEEAISKGYQVISFDLPEHGERKNEEYPCKIQNCVKDLDYIMDYAKKNYKEVNLFACSMGVYFSLVAYKDEKLNQSLFLSPLLDMERMITNMMKWFDIEEEKLKLEKEIMTPIGQKLYWDYYCYVKENPVIKWDIETKILYGSKDDVCELDVLNAFVNRFDCDLEILKDGEHYFHTKKQLSFFRDWIRKNII